MDFPIESIHRQAFKAHEAANCAGEQGKYWKMHDQLIKGQRTLNTNTLSNYTEIIALDQTIFEKCMKSGKQAAEIRLDLQEGAKAGIRGTPSFLLGFTKPGSSKIRAVKLIRGAQPYSKFKTEIENMLALKKNEKP